MSGVSLRDFLDAPAAEKPWPPQIRHLSQSSVGMLFRCARQFQHRYLLGEKERPGESIVVGSFFHEAIDFNYAQKIDSHEDLPLSTIVEYLHEAAVPLVLEESGGIDNIRWDTDVGHARGDAERITAAYTQMVVPRVQPVGREAYFDIDIPGVPVPVIGYLDVWEEGRTIDTKTGKQAATKVKPSWRLQGSLYALATGRPTEYHSISRAKQPRIVTALESEAMVVPVPTPAQVANMHHIFGLAAAMISFYYSQFGDGEWPANGAVPDFTRNMLPCDFCGWRQGCPAWT